MKGTLQQRAGLQAGTPPQHLASAPAETALTTNQADALNEIIRQLDGSAPRRTIALLGPRGSGKTTLIAELLESPRPRRTVLQRKVVGFVADAGLLDTRLAPWIQLVNSVLDKLTELAQPTPPLMIADLKTELRELVRLEHRTDEASHITSDLASAAFAHHWRSAFPRLLLDIVMQMNAAMVVALDHVEQLEPALAAQLLEAAHYFLNAAGCTTLLLADENALINKLDASGPGVDGEQVLNQWASTKLVLHPTPSGRLNQPQDALGTRLVSASAAARPLRDVALNAPIAPTNHADVPGPVLALLRSTGQLDAAVHQWRIAMRAVIRRAQDGQASNVSGELMAKAVALRYLHPELFESARLDAGLLVGLERRLGNARMAEVGNEFDKVVASDERLKALLKTQPLFGNVEIRDLATALRMTTAEDDAGPTAASMTMGAQSVAGVLTPSKSATSRPKPSTLWPALKHAATGLLRNLPRPSGSPRPAGSTRALPQALPDGLLNIGVALATFVSLAAGTFIVDRVTKLLMLGSQPAAEGLLRLDVSSIIPANLNLLNSGAAVAAELVGVALAVLIFVFWGRNNKVYAASLGLMLGAFAANLIDRMAYGAVLNYIHVGQLPTFNLAHAALAVGAVLLLFAMLSTKPAPERSRVVGR